MYWGPGESNQARERALGTGCGQTLKMNQSEGETKSQKTVVHVMASSNHGIVYMGGDAKIVETTH